MTGPDDETSVRDLLRAAGARELPPDNVINDARQAVYREWRQLVRQRRRGRIVRYGIAASLAAGIVAAILIFQPGQRFGEPIATVARVEGTLQMTISGGGDEWHPVTPGTPLPRGAMLRTDESTRAALLVGAGVSVRVDSDSLVELRGEDRIVLDSGALYVDSGSDAAAAQPLVIDTLFGSVRHVGTQYELRTLGGGIAVSVREGRIEVERAGQVYAGTAGERLMIPRQGDIEREAISTQDPRWQWATGIAPVFAIDRRSLSEFLEWMARETGKRIVYASPEVQARAEQLILRGSVSNLPPEQALAAVLATTPFTRTQTDDSIRIGL
ncbi:FecR domain-containing protein [Povalibacter sp.]|uniref:FecR domain-containing protein n=1 Tax=Povalibacter sp. TaxID=1962978 RepID=UPI002F42B133